MPTCFIFILALIIGLASPAIHAVTCHVTSPAVSGKGSLAEAVDKLNDHACTLIVFDKVATAGVETALGISAKNVGINGTLQSGGHATINGSISSHLLRIEALGSANVVVENLTLENTGVGYAYRTKSGSVQNKVSGATFKSGGLGVVLLGEDDNLLSANNYIFLDPANFSPSTALKISVNDFEAPSALTAAVEEDLNSWTVSGKANSGATRVELYLVNSAQGTIAYLASTAVTNGTFSFTHPFSGLSANQTFIFMALNDQPGSYRTSAFSAPIQPTKNDSFYGSLPDSCIGADWFFGTSGGTDGDADGEGLANIAEDANTNCAVDDGETDPTAADTDVDGVGDADDNCPLMANDEQTDSDEDGLGDLCDDTPLPAVDCALTPDDPACVEVPPAVDCTVTPDDPACETPEEPISVDDDLEDDTLAEINAKLDKLLDLDQDGIANEIDNCIIDANADQADTDANGIGDACENVEAAQNISTTTSGNGGCQLSRRRLF